jgi:hypothetical protein
MSLPGKTSSVEDRALKLLGSGIGPEQTATALGVSTSRISQLLSTPEFMAQVADLRFQTLAKHNDRDTKWDNLEDALLDKLENIKEFMYRPGEVLNALRIVNAAKRRGTSTPEQITNQQTVIQLNMPITLINKFTTNIHNQVIEAGTVEETQKLVTIQSSSLMDRLKEDNPDIHRQLIPSPENLPSNVASTHSASQRARDNRKTIDHTN